MSEIRHRVRNANRIAPTELGEGGKNPEGISGWMLGKNDVSKEAGQGLTDGELIKAYRSSDILKNYRLREEAMRRTKPIEFVTHTEDVREDQ